MIFWELLALAGTMTTIFGVFITVYAIINGRSIRGILREEAEHTREILGRIEQGQTEARREIAEARKEMAEAIKYLGQLIVSESEKTRQAIKP